MLIKLVLQIVPSGDPSKVNIAFFHPYCNAGGGGERVLWTSIQAIQLRYPEAECFVYTGDTDASSEQILENIHNRFNILLERKPTFIYLKLREVVEAKYYPMFTLLMQSLCSIALGAEALFKFRPDVYIDTMGFAFTYPLFRFIGGCKVASYTHYPTISSDMLERVYGRAAAHNNRSFISDSFVLSTIKLYYYHIFAFIYGLAGSCAHVVLVNSSWTKNHITSLWKYGPNIETIFPPCDTDKFLTLPIVNDDEKPIKTIVSIGQFRPEKDYPLQLKVFSKLLREVDPLVATCLRLVLIGGVRNEEDKARVQYLKSLATELDIADDKIIWKVNAPFNELLQEVQKGTIGIHTMWNEHFGIGIVESMAGGLIMVAHDSGGPKMDIVVPFEGKCTGFLASSEESYVAAIKRVLALPSHEKKDIREAARRSALDRFSQRVFSDRFLASMQPLLSIHRND